MSTTGVPLEDSRRRLRSRTVIGTIIFFHLRFRNESNREISSASFRSTTRDIGRRKGNFAFVGSVTAFSLSLSPLTILSTTVLQDMALALVCLYIPIGARNAFYRLSGLPASPPPSLPRPFIV